MPSLQSPSVHRDDWSDPMVAPFEPPKDELRPSTWSGARWWLTIAAINLASGWPYGIVNKLVSLWLTAENTSLKQMGLVSLIGLPWTFKVFWAPLVDRHGTARWWIAGSLLSAGFLTAALPVAGHTSPWFWILLLGIAFASATQDVAIDGYSTASTPKVMHGRLNGVRVAAYRTAMLSAGGGLGWLSGYLSWTNIFWIAGALCLIGALLATQLRELPQTPRPLTQWSAELFRWLRGDGWLGTILLVAFVLTFKLGDAAIVPMVDPFWKHAGLSVQEISIISITLGTALVVIGALVGGEITTRIGTFHALWSLGALQALSNLVYCLVALEPSRSGVYVASVFESLTQGLGTAAFLAVLTQATKGEQAATRFALLSALAGFTRSIAGATSGYITESTSYSTFFAITFVMALPAFLLLPAIRSRLENS